MSNDIVTAVPHYLTQSPKTGIEGFQNPTSFHFAMFNGYSEAMRVNAGLNIVKITNFRDSLRELVVHPDVPLKVKEAALSKLISVWGEQDGNIKIKYDVELVSIYLNPLGFAHIGEAAMQNLAISCKHQRMISELINILDEKLYYYVEQTPQSAYSKTPTPRICFGENPKTAYETIAVQITPKLRTFIQQELDQAVVLMLGDLARIYREAGGDPSSEGNVMKALKVIQDNVGIKTEFRTEAKRLYEKISNLTMAGIDKRLSKISDLFKPKKVIAGIRYVKEKSQVKVQIGK